MAVTRLQRRGKKNVILRANRQKLLKVLLKKPVIKNVDIEEIKNSFSKKKYNFSFSKIFI